jgi:hypothetical protein
VNYRLADVGKRGGPYEISSFSFFPTPMAFESMSNVLERIELSVLIDPLQQEFLMGEASHLTVLEDQFMRDDDTASCEYSSKTLDLCEYGSNPSGCKCSRGICILDICISCPWEQF